MGIKIISIAEAIENTGIKMLVHGQAGTGKTVLCATAGEPTLILSAEAGLLSLMGAPDYIKAILIQSIQDLEDAYESISEGLDGTEDYKWICLDSISEIAEQVLSSEKENTKDARQAYGVLSEKMTKVLRCFRDLPNRNVLMTCKQERQTDEDTGVTSYVPSLPGKRLTQGVSYMFDEVFAIRVEKDDEGEDYHILQCHKDRKYEAKDRSGALDMFEEPNLKRLAAKILAAMPDDVKEAKEKAKVEVKKEVKKEVKTEAKAEVKQKVKAPEQEKEVELTPKQKVAAAKEKRLAEEALAEAEEESNEQSAPDEEVLDENESSSVDDADSLFQSSEETTDVDNDSDSGEETQVWICVECDGEIISDEEPTECSATEGCAGEDFYEG